MLVIDVDKNLAVESPPGVRPEGLEALEAIPAPVAQAKTISFLGRD